MPGNKKPSRKKKKNTQKRNSFHNRKNVDTISSKVVLQDGFSYSNWKARVGQKTVVSPEVIASLTRRFPISEDIAREMIESGYLDPTGTRVNPAMLNNRNKRKPVSVFDEFDEYAEYDDKDYSLDERIDLYGVKCFKSFYDSPIGRLWLLSGNDLIIGSWFEDQESFSFGDDLKNIEQQDDLPCFVQTRQWLDQYFAGQNPDFADLLLDLDGAINHYGIYCTIAQKEACCEICQIPYGTVRTYSYIAKEMFNYIHPRTLAAKLNDVYFAVLLPSHRVVGSNGRLGGYVGGVERKKFLLQLEGVDISKFR